MLKRIQTQFIRRQKQATFGVIGAFKANKCELVCNDTLSLYRYVLKRVSFGSKDCTKELKPECAYFLGQTS